MKTVFCSFLVALSMFSIIPVPSLKWKKSNMRYMMCFFPLIGIIEALVLYASLRVCKALQFNLLLTAVVASLVPVFISGGVHLDGFADTCDAMGSHGSMSQKLYILHDSHVGTFAVIALIFYFLLYAGIWTELWEKIMVSPGKNEAIARISFLCGTSFVVERALSAIAVVLFPKALNTGLVHTFSSNSSKIITLVFCIFLIIVFVVLGFIFFEPLETACVILIQLFVFAFYYGFSQKFFGGITGDLAGWFVQIAELSALFVPAILF